MQKIERVIREYRQLEETLSASASLADEMISVVVAGDNSLSQVAIAPQAVARFGAHDLAALIVEAYQQAQGKVHRQLQQKLTEDMAAAGIDLAQLNTALPR